MWSQILDGTLNISYDADFMTTLIFTCLLAVVGAVLVNLFTKWLRMCWILRNVPKPPGSLPFLYLRDMYRAFEKMGPRLPIPAKVFNYLRYTFENIIDQDVTVVYFGPQPFLFGVTPDAMEAIMKSKENVNKPFLYQMMRPWVGNGLLVSDKEIWKPRRKILIPALHSRTLEGYIPIMNRRAEGMVAEFVKKGAPVSTFFNIQPIVHKAACAVMFETTMGVQIDTEDLERRRLLEITKELSASIVARSANIFHWPDFIYKFTKEGREFQENIKQIQAFNIEVVKQRKAEYQAGISSEKGRNSFMDILLRLHFEEGVLTEEELRDEVAAIFLGGFETTATAISFTLYLLGHHPEVQKKVHAEIDVVFGDDMERPITIEDIKQLVYTECVIKESMRLYPPLPIHARRIEEDIEIGQHRIPKGTIAFALLYFLHRHPKFVEQPDVFIPERFFDTKKNHPFLYVPFSAGPRSCIGQKFAHYEDVIFITQVLRRFKVESKVPMEKLQLAFEIVMTTAQGLELKFTPRD